jgi:hypothetical protein
MWELRATPLHHVRVLLISVGCSAPCVAVSPCCDVPWHVFVLPYSLFLVLMAPLITRDYTQGVLLVPSTNASGMCL